MGPHDSQHERIAEESLKRESDPTRNVVRSDEGRRESCSTGVANKQIAL